MQKLESWWRPISYTRQNFRETWILQLNINFGDTLALWSVLQLQWLPFQALDQSRFRNKNVNILKHCYHWRILRDKRKLIIHSVSGPLFHLDQSFLNQGNVSFGVQICITFWTLGVGSMDHQPENRLSPSSETMVHPDPSNDGQHGTQNQHPTTSNPAIGSHFTIKTTLPPLRHSYIGDEVKEKIKKKFLKT